MPKKATQLMPTATELRSETIVHFMDRLIDYKEEENGNCGSYPADTIEWQYKGHMFNIKILY